MYHYQIIRIRITDYTVQSSDATGFDKPMDSPFPSLATYLNTQGQQGWHVVSIIPSTVNQDYFRLLLEKSRSE